MMEKLKTERNKMFDGTPGDCGWQQDDDGNWETGCGELHIINEGIPSENNMHFCCYCGGKLKEFME